MSTTPQVIDSTAAPAVKARKSNKPPHVKAQVIAKRYAENKQIAEIAREVGISRPTVYTILAEADSAELDKKIECGRVACIDLIPKGAQAIEKAFDRGDGALAVRMFEGLGILGNENFKRGSLMKADVHLNLAIQNLIQAKPLESTLNCALADTPKQSEEK